jgi:hypothetical protein
MTVQRTDSQSIYSTPGITVSGYSFSIDIPKVYQKENVQVFEKGNFTVNKQENF